MTGPDKTTVVGVGNVLLQDEGIGVHVIRSLREMTLPNVELVDGGTSPDVLTCLEATDRLIIVDAAETGGPPGSIYRLRPEDLAGNTSDFSLHELGVPESLQMMQLMGNYPGEVIIIGIQPKEISWGMELTPELAARLPEIVTVVREVISG
jgi:hydrogenase maturation protease